MTKRKDNPGDGPEAFRSLLDELQAGEEERTALKSELTALQDVVEAQAKALDSWAEWDRLYTSQSNLQHLHRQHDEARRLTAAAAELRGRLQTKKEG